MRRAWVALFERYRVSMVVSGHSHVYQRGSLNGVVYVVCGGGGGALDTHRIGESIYSFTANVHHYALLRAAHATALEWRVYDDGDEEIDAVTIDAKQRGKV